MNKNKIIKKIIKREKLRSISKINRLIRSPLRTIPYYIIATLAKIKPFKIKFKTLWGDKMIGDLPNSNTFLYYGNPEANLTNFFIKNIKENDVFIDGGSNIGFYTLLTSRLVGNNGQIHSFEPTPSTFSILEKNINQNSIKNTKINNLALLNEEKNIEFTDYGLGYNSFNSIYKRKNIEEIKNKDNKINVETTTIDNYCKQNNIKPTFIKLDLEGSEFLAIKGSLETLKTYHPKLSIEVAGDKEWIDNISKTDSLLKEIGYKSYSINMDGTLQKHDLEDSYKYDNLIYIHDNY